jgi:hypothetical protein
MKTIFRTTLLVGVIGLITPAPAADLEKVDRTIKKEPIYQSKTPRYCLLVFGPEARDRVWLVHDGHTLYVDRNGNADLTEPGEKVTTEINKIPDPNKVGYGFDAGELQIGGRIHKGLHVSSRPLTKYEYSWPNAKPALAADPKAHAYSVSLDVEKPGFKGIGIGGRIRQLADLDSNGLLLFAEKPSRAPIIHLDGPFIITFPARKPILKLDRDNDVEVRVGTPGFGPGTFANLGFEGTIPGTVFPKVEILFPAVQKNAPPVRELYELKERC